MNAKIQNRQGEANLEETTGFAHNQSTPSLREEIEQSVPERFKKMAAAYGDRLALQDDTISLTYAQLNQVANNIAQEILVESGPSAEAVAILLPHGALQIVAMLAVLKTGKFYLPLDPVTPAERLRAMVEDAGAVLILTDQANSLIAEELLAGNGKQLHVDRLNLASPSSEPQVRILPDTLALLHYTSGSTGKPKGVRQTHRNINHFVITIGDTWPIVPRDRVAHFISCGFSAHIMTTFGALLNGAALLPFPAKERFPQLPAWVMTNEISIFFLVPSAFRSFCGLVPAGQTFPHVRQVVCAGETVYRSDLDLFNTVMAPDCSFRNLLASTEAYYLATITFRHGQEIPDAVIPVGFAVADKELSLIDEDGDPVAMGESGEIVVRSTYLSPGYWNQPLSPSLRANPDAPEMRTLRTGDIGRFRPDGALVHIGRKDFQVKIRGQRVELGEIETHLLAQPGIKDAAVTVFPDRAGNPALAAYIVPKGVSVPSVDSLKGALKRYLPDFMIPASINVLDSMPQTATGKVDRKALPAPVAAHTLVQTPYLAPRTEIETRLVEICESVVGVSPIGVQDNFYELGLDSLSHLNLFIATEKSIGVKLPVELLPTAQTVEALAAILEKKSVSVQPSTGKRRESDEFAGFEEESGGGASQVSASTPADELVKRIVQRLPYASASRFITWICGQRGFQERYLAEKTKLVHEFAAAIGQEADPGWVRSALAANFLLAWRYAALGGLSADAFKQVVSVAGEEHFRAALSKGQGVLIANNHFVLGHLLLLQLVRFNIDRVNSLGTGSHRLRLMGIDDSAAIKNLDVRADARGTMSINLFKAQRALEDGGVVHMAADGYQGSSGVAIPLLGRVRTFRSGFAELAARTGCQIVPASVVLAGGGRVRIEILPPLAVEPDAESHEQQVSGLIAAFAKHLKVRWQRHADNVTWLHMQNFLALPVQENPSDNYPSSI